MSTAQPLPTPEVEKPKKQRRPRGKYSFRLGTVELAALLIGILYMIPFYYVLSNW